MSDEQTDVDWLDPDQQRSWRAYLIGTTLLMERLDRDLREQHNLSMPEYEIMVRLSEAPRHRMRMALLADSVSHSRSRVTHTIARLEKAGMVKRAACADDGRGVEASISPKGLRALKEAAPTHVAGVREFLVELAGEEDFDALGRVFNTVTDKLIAAHPAADIR